MYKCRLALLLGSLVCGLLCVLSIQPAQAEDEADWEWSLIETLPSGWPFPLYLPDYGELYMLGWEGMTRDDVTDPFDFEWYYEAEQGSGDIGLIQGFFLEDAGAARPGVWADYDAKFSAELLEMGVEILHVEMNAQYGGRRWILYELLYPEDDSTGPIELLTLVNFGNGGMTFLNVFSDQPANEDLDAMLSLITGGPDAPQ